MGDEGNMSWLVIGTMNRGALKTPEGLGEEDALEASSSRYTEKALGVQEWQQRWPVVREDGFLWSA